MKVLITTSGLGNRLGNITKFTNKSLVRLGKVAAITRIIDRYPLNTEFIVTLGYYGNHVREYLQLAHNDKNITLINVDKYEGKGSSLLYSIYCAKDYLQSQFVYHACDSVVDEDINFGDGNVCICAWNDDTSQYRTVLTMNNKIVGIEDKGSLISNLAQIGVTKIEDYSLFWSCAEKLLNDFSEDSSLSDCHVITKMIENGSSFNVIYTTEWYDIGNSKSIGVAKEKFELTSKFKILDKEKENIFIFDKYVVKFFHDHDIVKNRVGRLDYLGGYGPKLLNYTDNFYKYEYVEGQLASHNKDVDVFYNFLLDLKQNFWKLIDVTDIFHQKTEKFYFDKTKDRVNDFYKQVDNRYENLVINGKQLDGFDRLMGKLPEHFICTETKTQFHGDFILDNLIIQGNKVKFLDWRQDFCGDIDGGDIYYDLAKMNHSLYFDHGLVSADHFEVVERGEDVNIELLCKFSSILKKQKYNQFLEENGFDINKIDILSSIIMLNMSPLHIYPLNKFLYFLGMYTLQTKIDNLKL